MQVVVTCPGCQHRIVLFDAAREERCGRCGTTVSANADVGVSAGSPRATKPAAAVAAPELQPPTAGVAPSSADATEWSGVRRGLRLVSTGIRTYLFAGLLAITGVVLWVYMREAVPREIVLGRALLGFVFAIPASFVIFIASVIVSAGRLYCLSIPSASGLRMLALLSAGGALLSFLDAFVVAIPLLLLPLSALAHLVGEVAFLLLLGGIGSHFGDTALAANAKRFGVIGVLGGALATGATIWAATLILADEAAAAKLVADQVEVVRGAMPGGAGPGFVGGLVGGFGLVHWFRWFEEPRLRGVGLLLLPGILFWAGGPSGIGTAFLGIVASAITTLLIAGYLGLLDEAIQSVPGR